MKGRVVWAVAAVLLLAAAGWLLPVREWLGAALTWARRTAHHPRWCSSPCTCWQRYV